MRWSKAANGFKLEGGEVVSAYGMKGEVVMVEVIRSEVMTDVLVGVQFPKSDSPVVLNLSQIEAVKLGTMEWVNFKGEPVQC
jgi:hypothetical protein